MIRVDAVWMSTQALDMRAGPETALARVVQVFGAARPHHAYLFVNARANRLKVLVLGGQINIPNGDFMLSGSSSQCKVMLMGRVDFGNAAMQGSWFLSKSASATPAPGGSFSVKH